MDFYCDVLFFLVFPDAPLINATTLSSTSIAVNWFVPFDGNSRISHFVLELKEHKPNGTWAVISDRIKQNENSFTVRGLKVFSKYTVRMKVINEVGESAYSDTEDVKTFPEGIIFT